MSIYLKGQPCAALFNLNTLCYRQVVLLPVSGRVQLMVKVTRIFPLGACWLRVERAFNMDEISCMQVYDSYNGGLAYEAMISLIRKATE